MKYQVGWTVYIVAELFRPGEVIEEKYYDIVPCKVESIPKRNDYQYSLISKTVPREMYWRHEPDIFPTYMEAIPTAEKEANKEDNFWEMVNDNRKVWRPWREGGRLK